jgi:hypothetical protein
MNLSDRTITPLTYRHTLKYYLIFLSVSIGSATVAPKANATDFTDDFNRPDSAAVGNGWLNTSGNGGGNLAVINGQVSPVGPNITAGIYRPFESSTAVTIAATLRDSNGFGGVPYRYDRALTIRNDGRLFSGYGVGFTRGDANFADSAVRLYDGAVIQSLSSSFQFTSSIATTFTIKTDGSVEGVVTDQSNPTNTFHFGFAARNIQSQGSNVAYSTGAADNRASTFILPRLDDLSLSTLPAIQKIILDFDDQAPFQITEKHVPLIPAFKWNEVDRTTMSVAATTLTSQDKMAILDGVTKTFTGSGITNVDIQIGHAEPGAKVIYFSNHGQSGKLAGYALPVGGGFNRFNRSSEGEAIVYSDAEFLHNGAGQSLDVNAAVHELGHTLGLRHVDTSYVEQSSGTTFYEVMRNTQYPAGTPFRFIDARSNITDANLAYLTHNPVYYLRRYIDGTSDSSLQVNGTVPGTWDTSSLLNDLRVTLSGTGGENTMYNVSVILGTGDDQEQTLAHFSQITLDQLHQQSFNVAAGSSLSLVGASVLGGQEDIVFSMGNPMTPANLIVPINSGVLTGDLVSLSGSSYTPLYTLTVTSTEVPEPTFTAFAAGCFAYLLLSRRASMARQTEYVL